MRKIIIFLLLFFAFSLLPFYVFAQVPTQEWVARYPRPSGSSGLKNYMALDKVGDCFVAGDYTDSSNNAVLIKYSSTGVQQWYRTYAGPGLTVDLPKGLAVDSIGNSYTTLSSGDGLNANNIITIKHDPDGTQQWIKLYDTELNDNPGDIAIDKAGNIYVTGLAGNESVLLKYKPTGDTIRVKKYSQPNYRFSSYRISIDYNDNVLIAGNKVNTTNGGQEYFVIKYDSSGTYQWIQSTSFNALTSLSRVKTDNTGNVIVTGMSLGGKIVTIKYNPTGTFQWQSLYDGPGSGGDVPYDMEVDKQSNIIITGRSSGIATGNYDYITIKYNTIGDSVWVKRYNGTSNANDEAYSLDLDDSNNVYITGRSINTGVSWDYVTLKYFSNGNQDWLVTYNYSPANSDDISYAVKVDKFSNVYLTGISDQGGGVFDYLTIKYSQPLGIINSSEITSQYILEQNYPNPFNPLTNIKYQITKNSNVKLIVFDITGKEITTLVNQKQNSGSYVIVFNAENISSGIYFYKLITEKYTETKKMIYVK